MPAFEVVGEIFGTLPLVMRKSNNPKMESRWVRLYDELDIEIVLFRQFIDRLLAICLTEDEHRTFNLLVATTNTQSVWADSALSNAVKRGLGRTYGAVMDTITHIAIIIVDLNERMSWIDASSNVVSRCWTTL